MKSKVGGGDNHERVERDVMIGKDLKYESRIFTILLHVNNHKRCSLWIEATVVRPTVRHSIDTRIHGVVMAVKYWLQEQPSIRT